MSHEIELKLSLPRKALPALRRHPLVAGAQKLGTAATLDNTYYDTPALDLKARKIGLRTRRQGRRWLQTVKCAAESVGGLSQRPEWEQPFEGAFDFSAVDAHVAKVLKKRAAALVPVFTTRFRRETRRCTPASGVSILMMIDTGAIEVDGRSSPICELELELEQGAPQDLLDLARELARTLPLIPSDVSKAERGYRLFAGETPRPSRAQPSSIAPTDTVIDAFRRLAADCLRQWQANAAGAGESDDPEFIHQLRISQRRLRSLMRLFAPALPGELVARWNERLRDNADRFGDARDLDVLCDEILAPAAADGADLADGAVARLAALADEARDRARLAAEHALDPAQQGRLMLDLTADLQSLTAGESGDATDLAAFAHGQLERLRKRARSRFQAAQDFQPVHLHALRIVLKRLRYGIEFFAPLLPAKATARYAEALVGAQSALGFVNDLDVARGRLDAWAGDDAGLQRAVAFVSGWHAQRYARLRRRALREVERLLWGKTPWKAHPAPDPSSGRNR